MSSINTTNTTNSATNSATTTAVSTTITSGAIAPALKLNEAHIDNVMEGVEVFKATIKNTTDAGNMLVKMVEDAKAAIMTVLEQVKLLYQSNKKEKKRLVDYRIQLDGESIQMNQEKAKYAADKAATIAKLMELKDGVTRTCANIKREREELKKEREEFEQRTRAFEAKRARIEYEAMEKQVATEADIIPDSADASTSTETTETTTQQSHGIEALVAAADEIEDGPDDESDDDEMEVEVEVDAEVEVKVDTEMPAEPPTYKVGQLVAVSFAKSKGYPVKALAIVVDSLGNAVYSVDSVAEFYGKAVRSSAHTDNMELVTSENAISLCQSILSESNLNNLYTQLKKAASKSPALKRLKLVNKNEHNKKVKSDSLEALKPLITFPEGVEAKRNNDSFIAQVAGMA